MSVKQWRAMERASQDLKHEYIDGYAYAMAGGSRIHARIASNMLRLLEDAVGTNCSVYNSDVAVRLSATRYAYPDATVSGDERDQASDETEITAARVIIEVLSPSTEGYDRGEKFGYYRACPPVQEYVLISTSVQGIDVFRRTAEGWKIYEHYSAYDTVELQSINAHIPVSAIYQRTTIPATSSL